MGDKEVHIDQKYVQGLLTNDNTLVAEIYSRFAPKVVGYIQKNSGDESAARDIIQEALITIYDQAKTKGLQLSCPFDAYFFLICKRKWLNSLKKNKPEGVTINEEITSIGEQAQQEADETALHEDRASLFNHMLEQMGEACKKLLKLSFSIKSMEEVARKLDVTYAYARKKKSLCVGKLTKMVQESTQYQTLKNL